MSKFTDYLEQRLKVRIQSVKVNLIHNWKNILTHKDNELMASTMIKVDLYYTRVDLLKELEALEKLQVRTDKTIDNYKYTYTDNNGSFFNKIIDHNTLIYD